MEFKITKHESYLLACIDSDGFHEMCSYDNRKLIIKKVEDFIDRLQYEIYQSNFSEFQVAVQKLLNKVINEWESK